MNGKRKRERKKETECEERCYGFVGSLLTVRVRSVYAVSSLSLSFCSSRPWPSHLATRSLRAEQWTVSIYLASLKRVSAHLRRSCALVLRLSLSLSLSLSISLSLFLLYYVPYVAALISTGTWTTKLPIATLNSLRTKIFDLRSMNGFCSFLIRYTKGNKNLATKKFRGNVALSLVEFC